MQALEVNPRWTFQLHDAVERESGMNTYDFLLSDDLEQECPDVPYEPANVNSGWIMLDVSNN
jgi:hypothetical protein